LNDINNSAYIITKCLICGSDNLEIKPAVISGFLLERIWNNNKNKETHIYHCLKCGFAFYVPRLNEDEMSKLYNDYRNDFYQKQRQKYDTWYTIDINNLFDDHIAYKNRQKHYKQFICKNINIDNIKSVLDYGGNNGKHIPDFFSNADKFVFDISEVETIDGVKGFSNLDECKEQKYDFIICTAMLEHVSDPYQILIQIKQLLNKDGYLYIDVPFDSPFFKHKTGKLQYIFNKYFTFKAILDRFFLNLKYPFIMHEHINYFSENSLKEMLDKCGFSILKIECYCLKTGLGKIEGFCALVKEKE